MTVPPGSVIGIVGGGQLGRMLALAAAQLGYRCHIYAPEADSVAGEVAALFTQGEYDDADRLQGFASACDVVTYEFENVPAAPMRKVETIRPVHPSLDALEIAQDRVAEKEFVLSVGGRPAPFAAVDSRESLDAALATIGTPSILKTRRFGYDGKGQARIRFGQDADAAWQAVRAAPSVLEAHVAFTDEFSIILCRAGTGDVAIWPAPRNVHEHGILASSEAPAPEQLRRHIEEAEALARRIADRLDYVGVLTLEFFATEEGAIFNEMAPRVHNSGHWTIEGAFTSQFENHVRAVCGLPLGKPDLAAPRVEMRNLIGEEAGDWSRILSDPSAHLHLYGKGEARPGRKMGHVTRLTGK